MRITFKHLVLLAGASLLFTGCASAEKKLGRGINNLLEPIRMGEMRRSYEQTSLYEGRDVARTKGVIHGINRTVARTAVGAFEILTFPIDLFDGPIIEPEHPVYPDTHKPRLAAGGSLETDSNLGFHGGDIAPFIPGSRFRIFE